MALAVMEDSRRRFYTSQLVKLELLPKAIFFQQEEEIEFYQTQLGEDAKKLAARHGLAAMDALHLAAALRQGAEEFITAEKPGKPMFRVRGISVKSIHTHFQSS
jgi:predicted nucleic acid-binding protein